VVGLVLIPFILVTVLGAVISCCRPNLVTSFLLPIPVFLLSLVLFGLYASVVATTCTSSLTNSWLVLLERLTHHHCLLC
jgi:hypothetical protein